MYCLVMIANIYRYLTLYDNTKRHVVDPFLFIALIESKGVVLLTGGGDIMVCAGAGLASFDVHKCTNNAGGGRLGQARGTEAPEGHVCEPTWQR